jgi:hypothetical protein
MYKFLASHPIVKALTSLKLTTLLLLSLAVLTFFGTLYQTEYGLYTAQQVYFNSWYVLLGGIVLFPGGQLVQWVLFINLLSTAIFRLRYNWTFAGLLLIHLGLLALLIGGGLTYFFSQESSITLREGQSTNYSEDYRKWEFFVGKMVSGRPDIEVLDLNKMKSGSHHQLQKFPISLTIEQSIANAVPLASQDPDFSGQYLNSSGINSLGDLGHNPEPESNMPALRIKIKEATGVIGAILYGGDPMPSFLTTATDTFMIKLRRKKYELPFTIKLIDFKRDLHAGTMMASSYESLVELDKDDFKREVRIYMNNPLRQEGYTLYQASFQQTQTGEELSTLAVVQNPGRLLPYISSLIIGLGLIWHFVAMMLKHGRRKPAVAEVS